MMDDLERITKAKNSIGEGFCPEMSKSYGLKTKDTSVYRVTGLDQIEDIIEWGYVRAKGYGSRHERNGPVVYWSIGGKKLNYYDRRPVIEAPRELVEKKPVGAISIDELLAIWIFDPTISDYIDNLDEIKEAYYEKHNHESNISR